VKWLAKDDFNNGHGQNSQFLDLHQNDTASTNDMDEPPFNYTHRQFHCNQLSAHILASSKQLGRQLFKIMSNTIQLVQNSAECSSIHA
jgi:hypothetical protein